MKEGLYLPAQSSIMPTVSIFVLGVLFLDRFTKLLYNGNQNICEIKDEKEGWKLSFVSDQYKTQEMFERVVGDNPCKLYYVSD